MITIANILKEQEISCYYATLSDQSLFQDGKATAGNLARKVKNNLQAAPHPRLQIILDKVKKALLDNPIFQAYAQPKEIGPLLISRYEEGMCYGRHVDDALMNQRRTDLSFTLFLSDPATYEGGELVIEDLDQTREIKLPAGQIFLYPTGALHSVAPVGKGVRLAIVGWIRSYLRHDQHRRVVFALQQALNQMLTLSAKTLPEKNSLERKTLEAQSQQLQALQLNLQHIRSMLLHIWAED